jgi:hypothetical protein
MKFGSDYQDYVTIFIVVFICMDLFCLSHGKIEIGTEYCLVILD